MTTQPIASSRPARTPVGQRRIRTAAAITAIVALIAAGSYLTITTGPDTAPPTPTTATATATDVNPSDQTLRDLLQSIAGQYGSQSAAGTIVTPSAQTMRELRSSVAGQYASRPAPDATLNPSAQVRRELRQSIAGQYGPAR
jgi:hypothetical protein